MYELSGGCRAVERHYWLRPSPAERLTTVTDDRSECETRLIGDDFSMSPDARLMRILFSFNLLSQVSSFSSFLFVTNTFEVSFEFDFRWKPENTVKRYVSFIT